MKSTEIKDGESVIVSACLTSSYEQGSKSLAKQAETMTEVEDGYYLKHLFICTNQKDPGKQCCADSGGKPYFSYLKTRLKELDRHGPGKIRVSQSGCLGRCGSGPCIAIYPEGLWYTYASYADIDEIINRSLIEGEVVDRLLI